MSHEEANYTDEDEDFDLASNDDDFDLSFESDDLPKIIPSSPAAKRRQIEDKLEERRLQKQLADEYTFDDD